MVTAVIKSKIEPPKEEIPPPKFFKTYEQKNYDPLLS